jgi:hypothetical protein
MNCSVTLTALAFETGRVRGFKDDAKDAADVRAMGNVRHARLTAHLSQMRGRA